jgi:hypothetical protein
MSPIDKTKRPANDNVPKPAKSPGGQSGRGPTRPARDGRRPPARTPRRSRPRAWGPAILATFFGLGCGPEFDPPSLVESTRVVGARVEVAGAPDRASPAPGESATATWFVTAPATTPPLAWAFLLCKPAPGNGLGCAGAPTATFTGTDTPPRVTFTTPAADALGGATRLVLYGRICASSTPVFDAPDGIPRCTGDGVGTTASLSIGLQTNGDANHNPTADRELTFDGAAWPALAAGGDPCVAGPRVAADERPHHLGLTAAGADRETYTADAGDPPVPATAREDLQLSLFTTAGKLKSPFLFVEAADARDATPLEMKWTAPKAADVTRDTAVTFSFVVRDDRGGADWTTRTACVTPAP